MRAPVEIQFREAILFALGYAPAEIIADGKIHRFPTSDKRGDTAGWYVLHDDGIPAGCFGDHRSGLSQKWRADVGRPLTRDEEAAHRARMAAMRQAREAEEARRRAAARTRAMKLLEASTEVNPEHPYLVRKNVSAHGIRQLGCSLVIPMCDVEGALHFVQFIKEDGTKKIQRDGRKVGLFHLIGGDPGEAGVLCVAEGYATGATIHEATGYPVAVAFDAGNLLPVARNLWAKYPGARMIFCADDDAGRAVNIGVIKATEAARAVGGDVTIPDFGTNRPSKVSDFNDLAAHLGVDAVNTQVNAARSPSEVPHPALASDNTAKGGFDLFSGSAAPVVMDSLPLSTLSRGALPGWFGEMVEAVAKATETPMELSALLGLACLGACCQKTFCIRPEPGYFEPLNIWTVVALPSGNRKSAVLQAMTQPIFEWERKRREALEPAIKDAESKRKTLEKRIDHLRSMAAKADKVKAAQSLRDIQDAENELPEIPHAPQRWVQDVTPERLGSLMAENEERMALLSAEGGIFEILGGRYSSGIPNLDLFLQAHSGDAVRVDRGTRDPVYLQHPALTLGLSPQPDVLRGLVEKPGFRARGLLARFLFALPTSLLGFRNLNASPVPPAVEEGYRRGLFTLLEYPPFTDADGRPTPHIIRLSPEAGSEWKGFQRAMEVEFREGGKFEHATDWGSKAPGQAVRIAGLLHCVESQHPEREEMRVETMTRALDLMVTLCQHAQAAFALMGADPNIEAAKKVWRWVEKGRRQVFTARDAFDALKGSFHRMQEINPAFEILIERHYITEVYEDRRGAGRPSRMFLVNPTAAELWHEVA